MKQLYRVGIIICVVMAIAGSSPAQSNNSTIEFLKTITPPSPNAASLGKYGLWPVSLFTGTPQVNIPVYEVKGRSVSVPIELSYHASGIKVGEVASWVGLGFALQCGGVITRSVRGLPDDEASQGYFLLRSQYNDPNTLSPALTPESVWKTHQVESANGSADIEHDIYIFNALGRSYQFLFRGDSTIFTIPYSNIRTTADFSTNTWIVDLEDGTRLTFGGSSNHIERTNVSFGAVFGEVTYTSSWYLKSVTSPLGEVINFAYTPYNIKHDGSYMQSDFVSVGTLSGSASCPPSNEGTTVTTSRQQEVISLLPSSIESEFERIEFIPIATGREDLEGGRALSSIKVFSKLRHQYIDEYHFAYEYSQAVPGNEIPGANSYHRKRLKLISLTRQPTAGSEAQLWQFEYKSQNLPSRFSAAQDHWGYFNGKTDNTSLLPRVYFSNPMHPSLSFNPPFHDIGGDREPDPAFTDAEMLIKVIYPTKGSSTFEFEANTITVEEEQFKDSTITFDELHLTDHSNPFITSYSATFTVTRNQAVRMAFYGYISETVAEEQPGVSVYAFINDESNTLALLNHLTTGEAYYNLAAGTYTFGVGTTAGQNSFLSGTDVVHGDGSMTYSASLGVQVVDKPVGGVRIKSIVDHDGFDSTKDRMRFFQYAEPHVISPGFSSEDYVTSRVEELFVTEGTGTSIVVIGTCHTTTFTRNAITKFQLGEIQGGTVGYGKVVTLEGANGTNGYTESKFSFEPDEGVEFTKVFPFPPATPMGWRRGLLISERTFTSGGDPVSKVVNGYNFVRNASVVSIKVSKTRYTNTCNDPYSYCDISFIYHYLRSEHVRLLTTRNTAYNRVGDHLDSLVTVVNYHYDNPISARAVRTETTNSKGEVLKQLSYTPLEKASISDLTSTSGDAIDLMVSRNMVSTVVEQSTFNNEALVDRTLNQFKMSGTLIVRDKIQTQHGTFPLEERASFNLYDAFGNITEQQRVNDVRHTYIWGYAGKYPVAHVTNCSASEVAYTSFEHHGNTSWTITSAVRDSADAVTGTLRYDLANGAVSRGGLNPSLTYIVGFWSTSDQVKVNGNSIDAVGPPLNGWSYYEMKVGGATSISVSVVSGNAYIDELRLHPVGSLMTTYAYDPDSGVTSVTDPGNVTTYYEYDSFRRLMNIRDHRENILKSYKYHYATE